MLISEDVPGPTTALEGVIAIRAADGSFPLEMSRRKVRDYAYGVGTLFESYRSDEAIAQARLLLEASDYIGLAATEFKRHAVTGVLYLIEINVRVPQSFGVSEAAGLDSSWRLYSALADLPVDALPAARYGTKAWLPQHDMHAIREQRPGQPQPGVVEVVRSLRGVRDFGGLSWRDPKPALRLAKLESTRAVRKLRSAR
jgi:predicted ATP-grasp superfamily ATP-dependent carboligase